MAINDSQKWRDKLTPEQFRVCWEKGTETPYSGTLLHNRQHGDYLCVCCKSVLFHADAKFDSGCGWPSFDKAIAGQVSYHTDPSHGMQRIEICCQKCGAHLGHVFDDGPTDTKQRYCVNSVSLAFVASKT